MAQTQDLQRLIVSLEARLDKFDKTMAKAAQTADKTGKKITNSFKKVEGDLARFGESMFAGLTAGAVLGFVRRAISDLADLADNAKRAGVSVDALAAAIFAARQEGGNAESMIAAFSKLNLELGEAASKGNELGKILEANNISIKELKRDPVKALLTISDLMKNAKDATDAAVIGNAAFGRGFRENLPFLMQGSQVIKAQMESFQQMVGPLGEITSKAKTFDDALTRITDVTLIKLKSNTVKIVEDFATLVNLAERLMGALSGGKLQSGSLWDKINRVLDASPSEAAEWIFSFNPNFVTPSKRSKQTQQIGSGGMFGESHGFPTGSTTKLPVTQTEEQKKAAREAERQAELIAKVIENLQLERAQLNRTDRERAIYNELARAGVELDSKHGKVIADLAGKFYDEQQALADFTDSMDVARDATRGFFGDLISGLKEGKSLTDALADAFSNLASKMLDRALDMGVDALIGKPGTANTGALGQILGIAAPLANVAPLANIISGGNRANSLAGGAGSDVLAGGIGTDLLGTQAAYLARSAAAHGVNPGFAAKVWAAEGKGAWQSNLFGGKFGKREPSFGPFQLLRGGGDTGFGKGLGNAAPFDVSDPSTWRQNMDFAMSHVSKYGWGAWAGAKAKGITGFMGVNKGGGTPAFEQPMVQVKESLEKVAETAKTAETAIQPIIPAAQSIVQTVAKALTSMGPIGYSGMDFTKLFTSGLAPVSGGLFGGGRADGGPVAPGTAYTVGERGPELFMPKVPGIISPNGGGRGGGNNALAVSVFESPMFKLYVEQVVARGNAQTLRTAQRRLPETQARYHKLGTTSR